MDMHNSKLVVNQNLEDMYNLFFEIDTILGYAFMHNQNLCRYIISQLCMIKQH
jgi:hypothetical protein